MQTKVRNGIEAWDSFVQLNPDVCILDIAMDSMDGIELTKKIKQKNWQVKVLLLTMHTQPWLIYRAKEANPDAILLKNMESSEILNAINQVNSGLKVFSLEIQEAISQGALLNRALLSLTLRETEILKLISTGLSTRAIAEKTLISVNTVETYRKNLFKKFEVGNMAELVSKAYKLNMVR